MKDKYSEYRGFTTEESKQGLVAILMTVLTPKEVAIFLDRSGLLYEGSTLKVAGSKHGIGIERTRQIENKILRKLTHPTRHILIFGS
jgi:DNA-directed RNA polymerase sigma subunit (sigma70/sigma32)